MELLSIFGFFEVLILRLGAPFVLVGALRLNNQANNPAIIKFLSP